MTETTADGDGATAIPSAEAPPDDHGDECGGLAAPGAKAREQALRRLIGDPRPEAVARVGGLALEDPNANVRRTAADVLGSLGPPALEYLTASLTRADEESFVRRAAAQALGRVGSDAAVAPLAQAAAHRDDIKLAHDCVRALGAIHTAAATTALSALAPRLRPDFLQATAVNELGTLGDADRDAAVAAVRSLVETPSSRVAKSIATALVALRAEDAASLLGGLLRHDDAGVRARAATSLGQLTPPPAEAVAPLVGTLLDDDEPRVRQAAAEALAARPPSRVLLDAVVQGFRNSTAERSSLDAAAVATALASALMSDDYGRDRVAEDLIAAAVDGDERVTGLLAAVLITCCGRDAAVAGELVNRYADKHPSSEDDLKRLRVEVGGSSALDPLFVKLREDLETYFQKPVHELNTETQESWRQAVDRARLAFTIRVVMSIVIFGIGVLLVLASAAAFLYGDLDTNQVWGTGGTFIGGVASMLAVTYSGPLKDVRQSMRDLASATAAFIGFVHQVLQVSHTFSSFYLRDRTTYADLELSSRLLRQATRDAVELLAVDREHAAPIPTPSGATAADTPAATARAGDDPAPTGGAT